MTYLEKLKKEYYTKKNLPMLGFKSRKWIAKKISEISILPEQLYSMSNKTTGIQFGKMYFYFYDPKTKEKLPYYDLFPLVVPMEWQRGGFLGLNLHYLDLHYRAALFDQLATRKEDYENFRITYSFIQGFKTMKLARPCIKRYLFDHVASRYLEIQPDEFDLALYMPVETFIKESKEYVWNESRRMFY